jgi:hypothetical protein
MPSPPLSGTAWQSRSIRHPSLLGKLFPRKFICVTIFLYHFLFVNIGYIFLFLSACLTVTKRLARVLGFRIRMFMGLPDPDPLVISISQRYGSGSGSFPFLINVFRGLKSCLQNIILTQNFSQKLKKLKKGVGSTSQRHLSGDPDPIQNVTDPQLWLLTSRLGTGTFFHSVSACIFLLSVCSTFAASLLLCLFLSI